MEDQVSILEDIKGEEVEAPYFQRLLTNLFDWIIEVALMIAIYLLLPKEIIYKVFTVGPYMRYVFVFIVVLGYRLFCLFLLGKTIGMLICRSKYLNGQLQELSLKEKLTAVLVPKIFDIKYYKS